MVVPVPRLTLSRTMLGIFRLGFEGYLNPKPKIANTSLFSGLYMFGGGVCGIRYERQVIGWAGRNGFLGKYSVSHGFFEVPFWG